MHAQYAPRKLKLYGFARVNKGARGNTRDLRVLWALEEIGMAYESVAALNTIEQPVLSLCGS